MKNFILLLSKTSKSGVTHRHTAPTVAAKILISVAFFLLPFVSRAQVNLVPNGSFEDFSSCPDNTQQVDSCIGWFGMGWQGNPQPGTPDYFAICSPYPVSVPSNLCGEQNAFHGGAYMGMFTYHKDYLWREIIGTSLSDSLIPGEEYKISMRVSRGNHTNQAWNTIATNNLGIRFTTFEHTINNPPAINNIAHVNCDTIITDTLNWVLLQWFFIADSAYTHLYLGNFFDDVSTDTVIINAPYGIDGCECVTSYYYIDSLNVNCVTQGCLTSIENNNGMNSNLIYYNNGYLIVDLGDNTAAQLFIYNTLGQSVINRKFNNSLRMEISSLIDGIYFVSVLTK